jgi:hypothetical protein
MPSYAFITAALAFASTVVANPVQLGKYPRRRILSSPTLTDYFMISGSCE